MTGISTLSYWHHYQNIDIFYINLGVLLRLRNLHPRLPLAQSFFMVSSLADLRVLNSHRIHACRFQLRCSRLGLWGCPRSLSNLTWTICLNLIHKYVWVRTSWSGLCSDNKDIPKPICRRLLQS